MCITYKGGDRLASEEKASKGVEDVFATYGNYALPDCFCDDEESV